MDVDNTNYEGVKVKEEKIEDDSYSEINCESIDHNNIFIKQECKLESIDEDSLNNIFIKQECEIEFKLDCAEDEHLAYDENLNVWTSRNVNSIKNYHEKQLFQCPECSVKTKYEANLNKHISFMHPNSNPPAIRQLLNKNSNIQDTVFLRTAGDKNNLLLQKGNVLENQNYVYNKERFPNSHKFPNKRAFKFNCSDCSFRCNLKFEFIFHVYECHYDNSKNNLQSKIFVCPYCSKQFLYNKKKRHLTLCRKRIGNYLQCDLCKYYFKGKYTLQKHIFNIHFKDGIFEKIANNLNQTILKPCPKCGKRFQQSSYLLTHIQNCGKECLYRCHTCLFTTNSKYSLANHILAYHLKKSNLCQNLTCS